MARYDVIDLSNSTEFKYAVVDTKDDKNDFICECEKASNANAIAEALNLGLVEVDFKHVSIATMENKKRIIGGKEFIRLIGNHIALPPNVKTLSITADYYGIVSISTGHLATMKFDGHQNET